MIAIIDYGAGNIQSVINAFTKIGQSAVLIHDPNELMQYDKALLPGVGAFKEAMTKLDNSGFSCAIKEFVSEQRPILGICLGMQLLFERSYEFGLSKGLGLLNGDVVLFDNKKFDNTLKVPHVGWNTISFSHKNEINQDLKHDEYFYFVHSYHVVSEPKYILGKTYYGYDFVSAVAHNNIYGFQPHPEKSHNVGLKILENFARL